MRGLYFSPSSLFSCLFFGLQVLQSFFNILAELYFAYQDASGPSWYAIRVQFHAVFSVEIKIFTGKGHGDSKSSKLRIRIPHASLIEQFLAVPA